MFYLVRIKELIRLEPMELGRNLRQCIKQKIEKTYVGSCQPQYGYFILLITSHENDERLKIEDGVIQDTSGDVIFRVEFMAIACLPERDEVLDGKVIDVMASGIMVQSGPIKTFISLQKDHPEYRYDN